jgi:hypothetical protein
LAGVTSFAFFSGQGLQVQTLKPVELNVTEQLGFPQSFSFLEEAKRDSSSLRSSE